MEAYDELLNKLIDELKDHPGAPRLSIWDRDCPHAHEPRSGRYPDNTNRQEMKRAWERIRVKYAKNPSVLLHSCITSSMSVQSPHHQRMRCPVLRV